MDHQRAGAAGDRRRDRRVLELNLRVLDGGAIGFDGGVQRGDAVVRAVSTCSRGRDAALGELVEALGLRLGVRRLRHVALEVGLRLLERRFERPAIELEQHLSLP